MSTTTGPVLDHSERAARDILNKQVRDGVIDRRTANTVLRTGLPMVRSMLATWRRQGTSPQWITEKFQAKLTEARTRQDTAQTDYAKYSATLAAVSAEMYLAVWAGLQADLAAHLAKTPADTGTPAPRRALKSPRR